MDTIKSIDPENKLVVAKTGEWLVKGACQEVLYFFLRNKNVLKLILVMVVQLYRYI
jgi:hypothetical protein